MKLAIVVNRSNRLPGPDDVSIMRPGPWGNPFMIGRDGTREQVVAKHLSRMREKLRHSSNFLAPLRGKTLVCCCKPEACHGDNLVTLIREVYGDVLVP